MKFTQLSLPGVWLICPEFHRDSRGYFAETFRADIFAQQTGPDTVFVQENESESTVGTIRGLHYQVGDAAQAKLVRVVAGSIIDVIVDLRRSSPTFGKHLAVNLNARDGQQLFIPRGFAHGFAVTDTTTRFVYKVDNYWNPEAERTLALDDPALGIEWPFSLDTAIISDKDRRGLPLAMCETFD